MFCSCFFFLSELRIYISESLVVTALLIYILARFVESNACGYDQFCFSLLGLAIQDGDGLSDFHESSISFTNALVCV